MPPLPSPCQWPRSCRASRADPPVPRDHADQGPSHIVVMVMENQEYDAIMVPGLDAPFLRSLAANSVSSVALFAITHPSLPNYIALTSGIDAGRTSDSDCSVPRGRHQHRRSARRRGLSWKAYMESMPSTCFTGARRLVPMKHDPFMYYTDIRNDPVRCNRSSRSAS